MSADKFRPLSRQGALIVALLVVAAWLATAAAAALAPFVFAAVAAYILAPLARALESRGAPPAAAAAAATAAMLALFVALPAALLPLIVSQLGEALADAARAAKALLESIAAARPDFAARIEAWQIDPFAAAGEIFGQADAQTAAQAAQTAAFVFGRGADAIFSVLGFVFVAPLALFYLLRDRRRWGETIAALPPPRWREPLLALARECDATLAAFLRGQLLVMLVMGIFYGVALSLLGAPYAAALGLVGGVLTFIPFAGFAAAFALSMLVCGQHFGWDWRLGAAAAAMLAGTAVESAWLSPRLVGERAGLGPIGVLLSLSVFGALLGFLGTLIALPLAAAAKTAARHFVEWNRNIDWR